MGVRARQRRPARLPAEYTGDGSGAPRFYRPALDVIGRPHVLVHRGDRTRLTVGGRSLIADEVEFMLGGNHRIDWVTAFALREVYGLPGAYVEGNPWSKGDIGVGSDVVIGRGARILSGLRIGDGAVVLPYSVVTRDVRPGQVVAGHPAVVVASRPPGTGPVLPYRATAMTASVRVRRATARILRSAAARISNDPLPGFPALHDAPAGPQPVVMGRASYFEPVVRSEGDSEVLVEIGPFASVSYDTEFLFPSQAFHQSRVAQRSPVGSDSTSAATVGGGNLRRTVVGADTWITRGTRVVGEITIGPGAVVGAYSVVYDDVRPYSIVAGNPAVEVGRRFDDQTVAALLRIAWWDWPEEVVKERVRYLCSPDVGAFIERYDPGPGSS